MLFRKYHIVVFKDSRGLIKKFSVKGYLALFLGVLFLGLISSNIYFWKYYSKHRVTQKNLEYAEKTVQEQKVQLLSFTNKLKTLEDDLSRIREFDNKLRVMINLDQNRPNEVSALGGAENNEFSDNYLAIHRQELLARKMHNFLDELRTDSRMEEVRQQEIIQSINSRRDILASTPSIWPTKGWISSNFGYRTSPFTGKREFHKGLDICGPVGTPIYAPSDGKVIFARQDSGYGRALVLDHGNGVTTRFAHLHKFAVKVGQRVNRGELIAFMGNSGRSTGPHLHYEVRINGVFVNPERYILN